MLNYLTNKDYLKKLSTNIETFTYICEEIKEFVERKHLSRKEFVERKHLSRKLSVATEMGLSVESLIIDFIIILSL